MKDFISAKFGVLEDRIIHLSTDEEIQMIKSLINDISNIQNESKETSLLAWATSFLSASFGAFLAYVTLSSDSNYSNLIVCLIFLTLCLGIYFLWNWNVNKKKETSALQLKQQELARLIEKIESRIPSDFTPPNKYEEVILTDESLQLKKL